MKRLGKRSYPLYMAGIGASGAGFPDVSVLACGGCRAVMAENRNTAWEGESGIGLGK